MRNLRSGLWASAGLALLTLATSACGVKALILTVDGLRIGDMGITGVALDVLFRVRDPNPEPSTSTGSSTSCLSTATGWSGASSL